MTDSVQEQLSACLDGELPEAELDLLLKRLDRDPELRQSLGRYALISQALQVRAPVAASKQFAPEVMAALESEPVVAQPVRRKVSAGAARWLRPVAGLAVAAGVATVAVLSLQPTVTAPELVATVNPAAEPLVVVPDRYVVPTPVPVTTNSLIPATRLTNYVVAHSEYSSPLGRRTVLSGVLAEDDDEEQVDDTGVDTAPDVAQ